jgi:hypothetical protein
LKDYWREIILVIVIVITFIATLLVASIPQMQSYHDFADQREILGVPNFFDVISNIPFAIVGIIGLIFTMRNRQKVAPHSWPVFFAGVTLVSIGSAYYHLSPNNDTLVWDRLLMTAAFMGLFVALLSEYVNQKIERRFLIIAVIAGIASVVHWHYTDDLRLYIWVQAVPLITVALILLMFKGGYTHQWYLFVALVCYLLAKVTELYDKEIFSLTGETVSGHTIKHILAALGAYCVFLLLKRRRFKIFHTRTASAGSGSSAEYTV